MEARVETRVCMHTRTRSFLSKGGHPDVCQRGERSLAAKLNLLEQPPN